MVWYEATTAPFGRVLTAMVTPFTESGQVDYAQAAQLAVDLVELGNDGLVVNGTTGESPTTTDAEKERLVQAVAEAVGDRACVVAGVGTNNTAHTLHLSQQAAAAGADALLVVTPYYNKPPQDALVRHFQTVADGTDLPVMLYDIPGRAGVPLSTDTLCRLAEHPRILANKDAKGDPFAASVVMSRADLAYYSGDDGLNLALLALGAVGFVSVVGHLAADKYLAMHQAYSAGDVRTAQQLNTALVPLVEAVMTRTQGVIATKAALDLLGRAGGGGLRAPLYQAGPQFRTELAEDLRAAGLIA